MTRSTRKAMVLDRFLDTTATALVLVTCLAVAGCTRRAWEVLVDLPPAAVTERPAATGTAPQGLEGLRPEALPPGFFLHPADTVTPQIELTMDPDSVLGLLPSDHAGNVDWVQAIRDSVIRPRNGKDGPRGPDREGFQFKFDFYFPGPNPMFNAFFPHSVHTEIIDCAQCHPRIFTTRGQEFNMADVLQGRFCGECHGTVAFNPTTACERCHTGMSLPPNRAQKQLTGTIQMRRATEILAELSDSTATIDGNASGVRTDGFPRARFPHWVHRIRYQCKTCHTEIFEPEAGANAITMVDIAEGRACGQCHDGITAFIPSIANCNRCHPEPTETIGAP